jgi:hypothetical protein
MLSQALSARASPRRPVLFGFHEIQNPLQDPPLDAGSEAGCRLVGAADQEPEILSLDGRPEDLGASGALPEEVPYEIPGLSSGELRMEEPCDDLVREVLVRHVVPPEGHQSFIK